MFNCYVDNKFNYNVNAVSGTLRKIDIRKNKRS